MAYYDEPFVDPLDFDAQEAALAQQVAHIQALRQMSQQPVQAPRETGGWTSAVTGTRVPGYQHYVNPLSALTPLVADYTAGREESDYRRNKQRFVNNQIQHAGTWAGNIPKGEPARLLSPGLHGPQHEAQPPTQQEMLGHAASGLQMPLTRQLAMELIKNQMIDVPKEGRVLEAKRTEHQRDQDNKDREFNEKVAYHQALLGKPSGGGSFVQNGDLVTEDGAPVFTNFATGQIGWLGEDGSVNIRSPNDKNMPATYRFNGTSYEKVSPSSAAPQQGTPQVGTPQGGTTGAAVVPPLVRKPHEMPSQAAREITELGTVSNMAKDLKDKFPANVEYYNRMFASSGGLAGKALSAGMFDFWNPELKKAHEYFTQVNELVARRLLAQGGKTLTANEIKVTMDSMPSTGADKPVWDRWFDRFSAIASVEARRREALHIRGNHFDEAFGAVVDMKGRVVKGTESPFPIKTSEPVAPAPAPAPAASAPGRPRRYNQSTGRLE